MTVTPEAIGNPFQNTEQPHASTAPSNPESRKIDEFGAFDVLRFGLAATVTLSHIGVFTWEQSGNLAVQVFFALSGWLIGTILYRTKASELSRFYYNRSTRVWIPYGVCVAALYLVSALHEPRSARWFEFLGYDVTFTHNWFTFTPNATVALNQMPLRGTGNHFWSLAVEEQFYLFAPIVITLLPIGRSILVWTCFAAVAYLSGSEYASISISVLAVMVTASYPGWYRTRGARWGLILTIVVAAGAMIALPSSYSYASPPLALATVLLCAQPLRRTAITRWLGGVSFPLYLNAWIGIFVLHALEKHFGIHESSYLLPVEFAFALGSAALTYHIVDVQVMERRDTFYRPAIGWAVGVTGYLLVLSGVALWLHLWHGTTI
jgi:peptidoglycan/LPS O-acetylase OafA/YrhL